MKYTLLLISILLLHTTNALSENTIEWESDKAKVKAKASGLFSKTKTPKLKNSKNAPSGSVARAMAVDGYKFKWRPRWNFVAMGGSLLPFVLESSDESVLGIVETLPQKNASSSSIIVFINLHDLHVNNYLVMTGKNVRKFCFVPFSSNIVCLIKLPYDKYDQKPKFQLQTIDTHVGFPVSTTVVIKDIPSAFCSSSNGSKLFVAFKGSNKIRVYTTKYLSKDFTTLKTAVNNPVAITRSLNGKRLLVTGSEKIQVFNIEQQPIPEENINLPEFFQPDKIVLCSDDASTFLISRLGGATYFYNGKSFIKIVKRTDNDINWSRVEQSILIGLPQKSTIAVYSTSNLETPLTTLRFQKARPATTGKLDKIISLPTQSSGIAILDKRGALLRIYQKRHRWLKEIIIDQPTPQ
jgi:hypothetical protein